jgi:long-subunit acyl-CoA synthetase (AMP-forming)
MVGQAPKADFFGSRNDDEKAGRPFVWKSREAIQTIAKNLASGYKELGLIEDIEVDGRSYRIIGIMAKNREEWADSYISCMYQNVTIATFYDSYTADQMEFVIDLTTLSTMAISGAHFDKCVKLKQEGRTPTLKNLVVFDPVSED